MPGADQVADNLTAGPRPDHAERQSVFEDQRPAGGSGEDEVAIGADVTILDQRLHHAQKRDIPRSARIVVLNAEELLDTDCQRTSLAYALLEFVEVTAEAVPVGIVFVDEAPAIADEPAIDAVSVRLAFVEGPVIQHPLHLRKRSRRVVPEEA